jgi:hypothetical protein
VNDSVTTTRHQTAGPLRRAMALTFALAALVVASACTKPPDPGPGPGPITYRLKDFSAHINAMPGPPPGNPRTLYVQGTVVVGHPGHKVTLTPASPQGFNPRILLMNLTVERLDGVFPQVETEVPVRYVQDNADYTDVTILTDSDAVPDLNLKVIIAH